jgi:hypothetical protein
MAKSKNNPLKTGMVREWFSEILIDKNRRIPLKMRGSIKEIQDLLLQVEQNFPNHTNIQFMGYSSNNFTADRPETEKETEVRLKREAAAKLVAEKRAKTAAERKAKKEAEEKAKREKMWKKLKEEFGDK